MNNFAEIDDLTKIISIDHILRDTVYAYANEHQMALFLTKNYPYDPLPHPGSLFPQNMYGTSRIRDNWDSYPTYETYLQLMRNFAIEYPEICKLDTFGYSVQNRLLLNLVISDNVNEAVAKPKIFYSSTIHGDETVGYVLLLRLADFLLKNYGDTLSSEGKRITRLMNGSEIWINPLFNPDGTYYSGNHTVVGAKRYNANGVDLNRNFPDRISDPENKPDGREPETRNLMALVKRENFNLSAALHGGAQVVSYPWDNGASSGSYASCPDDAWYINISKKYASTNPDILNGGFSNGITNGCEWYVLFGGRQDWIYFYEGSREITVEISNIKNPPGSLLLEKWENNIESFLSYMENIFQGIHGTVVADITGKPLEATIEVIEYPAVSVYSDGDFGNFYRFLLPGIYTLVVSSPGYQADTLKNITVNEEQATQVSVVLSEVTSTITKRNNAPKNFFLFQNYPNPFNPKTIFKCSTSEQVEITFCIYNPTGQKIESINLGIKSAGEYQYTWDGSNYPSGLYLLNMNLYAPGTKKLIFSKMKKILLLK